MKSPLCWYYKDFDKQLYYTFFKEHSLLREGLVYYLTHKIHRDIVVIPHPFAVELSNKDIRVFIIHSKQFLEIEYSNVKVLKNCYIVVFDQVTNEIMELKENYEGVVFINKKRLVSSIITLSDNKVLENLFRFIETDVI